MIGDFVIVVIVWTRSQNQKTNFREGHASEKKTGFNPRLLMSQQTAAFLKKQRPTVDATIFAGDLNDRFHPRPLLKEIGFVDTFSRLGLPLRSTWPTPSWNWFEDQWGSSDSSIDFIFTSLDDRIKVITSQVLEFSFQGVYPSDHYPVMAMLDLTQQGFNRVGKITSEAPQPAVGCCKHWEWLMNLC